MLTRPIAFHPMLARICGGDVSAGVFLSQALYWSERTAVAEGWFYKTVREWEEETCLSRHQLDRIRRKLAGLGFLECTVRGMPAIVHFRVGVDAVHNAVAQFAEKRQTGLLESGKLDSRKPAKWFAGNQQNSLLESAKSYKEAEITAETTSESQNHHACGAMTNWLSIKAELQKLLSADEYKRWLRPMYLLKVLSGNVLLLALPPNGEIVTAVRGHRAQLLHAIQEAGYTGFTLTKYPDGYERDRLRKEHPEFYEQMLGNKSAELSARATNPARMVPVSCSAHEGGQAQKMAAGN